MDQEKSDLLTIIEKLLEKAKSMSTKIPSFFKPFNEEINLRADISAVLLKNDEVQDLFTTEMPDLTYTDFVTGSEKRLRVSIGTAAADDNVLLHKILSKMRSSEAA